jgi:PAS domain S-box-containing protein
MLAALSRSAAALALVNGARQMLWCSDGFAQAICDRSPADCVGQTLADLLDVPWAGNPVGGPPVPMRIDVRGRTWSLCVDTAGPGRWLLRLDPVPSSDDLRRQLADLRERLEIVQHFCQAGFFERDPQTRQGSWDGHMYRIFGLEPPVDAPTAPPYEQIESLLLPEDRMPKGFETTLGQPGKHAARLRMLRPDGQLRHIHSQWRVLQDEQGQAVRVVGVNIDDTDVFELARSASTLKEELELVTRLGNIGLWRHDLATDRIHFDERACLQLGLRPDPDGMPRAAARQLVHPDDIADLQASYDDTLRSGLPTDMSIRYKRPGGGWVNMLSRRTLQRDACGEPIAFIGVLLDETERVERIRAAQESSERLEAAAEAAGIGLWSTEVDGSQPRWNPRLFKLLGLEPTEGSLDLGSWLRRCVHADDRDRVGTSLLAWARKGSQPIDIEFRIRRVDDGALRWLVLRGDIDRRSPQGPRRVEGVVIDITEQRELTRQLREAAERVALTASAVGLGSWQTDAQGQVGRWDAGMYRLRGLQSPAGVLSQAEMLSHVHPEDRDRIERRQNQLGQGGDRKGVNFRVIWPDGTVRWLASRSAPQFDAEGRFQGRIGLNWDVTESVLAEQAIRERELILADSRAKSRFLSRVSHELRTPLNAVLGFTQLLRNERRSADPIVRQRWLDHVDDAGRHLLALIDDVLDLSRLDGGEMMLKLQAVALRELVASTLPLVEGDAQSRGVSLILKPGPAAVVQADPLRLRQVLLNLLSNAIKYNQPGGSVQLGIDDDGQRVRLQVSDTGRGIEAGNLQAVFEPFNRLGAEDSGIAGTGIGLAIAKALVDQMGGAITVSSEPGKGSVFNITLPRSLTGPAHPIQSPVPAPEPAHAHSPTAPQVAPGDADHPPARLLYIEDNPINALLLQEMLADEAWVAIEVAGDGRSGLEQARARPPDLLLLDMQLPDMSGLEVLHALKSDPATANIPCVALSANGVPRDIARAKAAGAVDYWTKPIDFPVLLCRLATLLGRTKST